MLSNINFFSQFCTWFASISIVSFIWWHLVWVSDILIVQTKLKLVSVWLDTQTACSSFPIVLQISLKWDSYRVPSKISSTKHLNSYNRVTRGYELCVGKNEYHMEDHTTRDYSHVLPQQGMNRIETKRRICLLFVQTATLQWIVLPDYIHHFSKTFPWHIASDCVSGE